MFGNNYKFAVKLWHGIAFGAIILAFIILKLYLSFHWPVGTLKLGNDTMNILVANTSERWYKGLSDRKSLGEYGGMWFSFMSSDYHTMVMRNMKFPLDIIWLDNGIIVDMAPNVQPEAGVEEASLIKYRPRLPSNAVLEISAGAVGQYGLKIGDKLEFYR